MRAGGGIRRLCRTGAVAAAAALSACTVGPDYQRPIAPVPAKYKEARPQPGWKLGQPSDAYQSRRLVVDLQRSGARRSGAADRHLEPEPQSRRGGFAPGRRDRRRGPRRLFPDRTVDLQASARAAAAAPRAAPVRRPRRSSGGRLESFFSDEVAASWTPDFWGQIRRMVEANVATAQASAADLANARLSAQGTLAGDYLQLRIADELKRLLDQIGQGLCRIAAHHPQPIRSRHRRPVRGLAGRGAIAVDPGAVRSRPASPARQFEHAIAVLIGVPPAELTIAPTDFVIQIPGYPARAAFGPARTPSRHRRRRAH